MHFCWSGIFFSNPCISLLAISRKNTPLLLTVDIPVILTTRFGDIDHPLGCVSLNTMA